MGKIYVLNIVDEKMKLGFAEVHVIAYNPPKLTLHLGAKFANNIRVLKGHVAEGTIMNFQLEYRGNQLWESPLFRAQVTSADEKQLQFELTVLDQVDLSGLETTTAA